MRYLKFNSSFVGFSAFDGCTSIDIVGFGKVAISNKTYSKPHTAMHRLRDAVQTIFCGAKIQLQFFAQRTPQNF
jgi:hypothetical protein